MREETLVKNLLQYKRVLEGMLFAMTGDAAAAEDLYQEMAILMTRKRDSADEDCKFVAWGRQIALNLVRDWRKKLARGKVQTLDDDVLEAVAGAFESAADSAWDARREALRLCADTTRSRCPSSGWPPSSPSPAGRSIPPSTVFAGRFTTAWRCGFSSRAFH